MRGSCCPEDFYVIKCAGFWLRGHQNQILYVSKSYKCSLQNVALGKRNTWYIYVTPSLKHLCKWEMHS